MSESESCSSKTDSEGSSDGEDVVEQSSVVQPYQFEPEAESDYEEEENDEDGISRETLELRANKTIPLNTWCTCGHCSDTSLLDAREYRCCKEILACTGKFTFEGKHPDCITKHWDYAVITHRTVLETAGAFLTTRSGKKYRKSRNRHENEYIRSVAYRWIVRWVFGFLGWENSRPLPACVYEEIRARYSSAGTSGYKTSQQRR